MLLDDWVGRPGRSCLDGHALPWSSKATCELHVLGLNRHSLGVDSTEITEKAKRRGDKRIKVSADYQ